MLTLALRLCLLTALAFWKADAADQSGLVALKTKCCNPGASLQWYNVDADQFEDRAPWVNQQCTCLRTEQQRNATGVKGSYHHFHYVVTDLALNDATSAGRVTFELVTCTGKAHLFVRFV